jgi:hypothetical protein
MALRSVKL